MVRKRQSLSESDSDTYLKPISILKQNPKVTINNTLDSEFYMLIDKTLVFQFHQRLPAIFQKIKL
jgi:hypothetical protein